MTAIRWVVVILSSLAWLGCASVMLPGEYDRDAKETMGRVVAKKIAAVNAPQAYTGRYTTILIPAGGVVIPVPLALSGTGPNLTIYEYVVSLPSGRQVSVYSDYAFFETGNCVKLFESDRPTYPRLAPGWDCAN